jgi:hypothetical protein
VGLSHPRRGMCRLSGGERLKRKFKIPGDYFSQVPTMWEPKNMASMLGLPCIEVS